MKFLSIIAILFSFTQCGATKLQTKPPFKIATASYNNWVGGLPGVSGTRVSIVLKEKSTIVFDSLFFQNKKTKIEVNNTNAKMLLIAHFDTSNRQERELVLDANPTKELKNTLPKTSKFPFDLKEDEAILCYKVGDKLKYYKVLSIKKQKPVFFPSAKPRN